MRQKTYLEIWPVLDCNLKCKNCSMGSPYFKSKHAINLEQFKKDCDRMKDLFKLDVVRISGGEPTTHPDIVEIMKYPKECGLVYKTNLITNCLNLVSQPDEFWEALDILNISVYQNTNINYDKVFRKIEEKLKQYPHLKCNDITDPEVYNKFKGYEKDIKSKGMEVNIEQGYFKRMWATERWSDEKANEIFSKCWMKDSTWGFHDGYFYRCPITLMKDKLYEQESCSRFDFDLDRINIHDADAEEQLTKLLEQTTALEACKTCYGFNTGVDEPHEQMDKNKIIIKDILYA